MGPWGDEQHSHPCHWWCRWMLCPEGDIPLLAHIKSMDFFFSVACGFFSDCRIRNWLCKSFFIQNLYFFLLPLTSEKLGFQDLPFSSLELCVHSANMATFNPYFYSLILYSFSPRQTYLSEHQYIFVSAATKMLCFFHINVNGDLPNNEGFIDILFKLHIDGLLLLLALLLLLLDDI